MLSRGISNKLCPANARECHRISPPFDYGTQQVYTYKVQTISTMAWTIHTRTRLHCGCFTIAIPTSKFAYCKHASSPDTTPAKIRFNIFVSKYCESARGGHSVTNKTSNARSVSNTESIHSFLSNNNRAGRLTSVLH